jgi:nucleoside 2-deoxyribosyltransferase
MTKQDASPGLADRVRLLVGDAEKYFASAIETLASVKREGRITTMLYERDPDHFFSQLNSKQRHDAEVLVERLIALGGEIATSARTSVLVTDADQLDIATLLKGMRAALRLRRYRAWDSEVLHDEGVVLGVRRASQSDDEACPPEDADRIFSQHAARLMDILNLILSGGTAVGAISSTQDRTATTRLKQNTAFIMMWIDKSQTELEDVATMIKETFRGFGIEATRADDIEHEGVITDRILAEIRTAEFLIADLTGARPSVYYEVGYAHALGRRVILYRKKGTGLHFDLAGYNCPEYDGLIDLRKKLTKRLSEVTNKQPGTSP